MKVLIVEDNKQLADTIKDKLRKEYVVDIANTGDKGEYLMFANEYDIVLLDLNLPDMDGTELCKKIRSNGLTVPIIAITGRSALVDKVNALDIGVDDYLTKPFAFAELLARIRSLLRRKTNSNYTSPKLSIDGLLLDTVSHEVAKKGKYLNLRQKEFQLLEYLMRNHGIAITRDQILEHVWDSDVDPITNTVDVHINSLRRKIGRTIIKTIHGVGYMLKA